MKSHPRTFSHIAGCRRCADETRPQSCPPLTSIPGENQALDLIRRELDRAYEKHGRERWGRHEFYGILKEEVDELWDAIKGDHPIDRVLAETVQVAAVCVRYLETGDRYWGEHPTLNGLPSGN